MITGDPKSYLKARKEIAAGRDAISVGAGVHPEGGPFLMLTANNDLIRMEGKAMEWIIPASEAAQLAEMLVHALITMSEMADPASPSKANH